MESKNDIIDMLSLGSKKSSSINSRRSQKIMSQVESEDISISQLEVMANKKKLNKKSEEISVSQIIDADANPTNIGLGNSFAQNSEMPFGQKLSVKKPSSVSSLNSTASDATKVKRRKERAVAKENQNDQIRKEKSELLYKFNKANVKGKWSSLRLDMNCSLEEIRNEYERVVNEIQTERSVGFFKRMLLLGVQGVEMLNTKFDPLGVDLDGWSEAMGYSLENQEYDEVMAELYQKYKGVGQMSPEMKLLFMIISSATMFTITKKITKMDSSNFLKNLMGGVMGGDQKMPQSQFQQPPPQFYQNQQNPQPQQFFQQPQGPNPYQPPNQNQHPIVPNVNDLYYETSEDPMPSKIKGPNVINVNDGVDINNILKTMDKRKNEKNEPDNSSIPSEDLFRSIALDTKKKPKGRRRGKAANTSVNLS